MNNLNETEQYFYNAMNDQGIPLSDDALNEKFDDIASEEGLQFKNPGEYSPFYRFVKRAMTAPVLWLIEYLIKVLMPSFYLKTAKAAALDLKGWEYDIPRKAKTKLTGRLIITRNSVDTDVTLAADEWIKTAPINGKVYRVKTIQEATFTDGELTAIVDVEAETEGSAFNLAAGYFTILENPVTGLVSVRNSDDWIIKPGADDEPDDDYRLRIQAAFTAVTSYHVNSVYKSIIAQVGAITYDRIFINHTVAPRGPGSVDAYVLFDAGVAESDLLTPVNKYIRDDGHHGHGDDVLVKAMPESQHDVSATLWVADGLSDDQKNQVKKHAEQMVRAAFRENLEFDTVTRVFPYSRFSFQGLGARVMQVRTELISIEWGQGDIVSQLDIPRLRNLTLTVKSLSDPV